MSNCVLKNAVFLLSIIVFLFALVLQVESGFWNSPSKNSTTTTRKPFGSKPFIPTKSSLFGGSNYTTRKTTTPHTTRRTTMRYHPVHNVTHRPPATTPRYGWFDPTTSHIYRPLVTITPRNHHLNVTFRPATTPGWIIPYITTTTTTTRKPNYPTQPTRPPFGWIDFHNTTTPRYAKRPVNMEDTTKYQPVWTTPRIIQTSTVRQIHGGRPLMNTTTPIYLPEPHPTYSPWPTTTIRYYPVITHPTRSLHTSRKPPPTRKTKTTYKPRPTIGHINNTFTLDSSLPSNNGYGPRDTQQRPPYWNYPIQVYPNQVTNDYYLSNRFVQAPSGRPISYHFVTYNDYYLNNPGLVDSLHSRYITEQINNYRKQHPKQNIQQAPRSYAHRIDQPIMYSYDRTQYSDDSSEIVLTNPYILLGVDNLIIYCEFEDGNQTEIFISHDEFVQFR